MVLKITNNEYIKILEFYKIPIPGRKNLIQKEAEKILAEKLCKCIKQIDVPEPRSIGICTKSIFNKKGLTRGKFQCKNKKFVTFRKTSLKKTRKTNK
jgi:hypothetical protein